jgi:cyclopropane fatty-acyl-phospholipid synthase-like methyltransferase
MRAQADDCLLSYADAMSGTPASTQDWVRAYYAESTDLIVRNWAGSVHAFHLGLDDGTCATRDEALAASNAYLARRAGIERKTRVLDAGCGVGGSSIWLATHRGAEVVGITIAPEQVAIAEKLAREAGVTHRTTFHEMDFAATTFPPASFDVVWNIESMCHAFDKREYMRHVLALLCPGGRFACLDMFGYGPGDAAPIRAMCTNWSLTSLPSVEEVRGLLDSLGFEGVESEDLTEPVRRPVAALEAMARNAQAMLRIERMTTGSASAVYDAHVLGALACAEGVAQGCMQYAYVGGRKPG